MSSIAERLAEARRRTGLSLRGFAAVLQEVAGYSVSHTTVAQYERGMAVPAEYVAAVCGTFNLSPVWVLRGEGIPEVVDPPLAQYAIEKIARIVDEVRPALGAVEAKIEEFFRVVPALFAEITRDLHFARLNPAWERQLGYGTQELLGVPLTSFVHPRDRRSTLKALRALGQGGPPREFVNRLRRRDGTYRRVVWSGAYADGLIYAVAVDITNVGRGAKE